MKYLLSLFLFLLVVSAPAQQYIPVKNNAHDMRSMNGSNNRMIALTNGLTYMWNAGSTASTNRRTVFSSLSGGTGRWHLLGQSSRTRYYFPAGPVIVAGFGDSNMAGIGATLSTNGGLQRWHALYAPAYVIYKNTAVSGRVIADVDTGLVSEMDPWAPRNGTNGVAVGNLSYNDINTGSSASTVITGLSNVFTRLRTNHWMISFSCVNASIVFSVDELTVKAEVNRWLKEVALTEGLIDWLLNEPVLFPGPPNTGFYFDGGHLNETGYLLKAGAYNELWLRPPGSDYPSGGEDPPRGANQILQTLTVNDDLIVVDEVIVTNRVRVNSTQGSRLSVRETTAATKASVISWTNNTAFDSTTEASYILQDFSNDSTSSGVAVASRFLAGGQRLGVAGFRRSGSSSDYGLYFLGTYSNNTFRVGMSLNTSQTPEFPLGAISTMSQTAAGTNGLRLINPTAATVGVQQFSPSLEFEGFGWKTDATAGSQSVRARIYLQPVQDTANPKASIQWDFSINGAAFSSGMTLSQSGTLVVPTFITGAGGIYLGSSSGPTIIEGTGAPGTSPANGSLFHRTDGTGDSFYIRKNGAWKTPVYGTGLTAGSVSYASDSRTIVTTDFITIAEDRVEFAAPFMPQRVTKAARDALSGVSNGYTVYQTDNTEGPRMYVNGAWNRFTLTADP